ncbi:MULTISPECIES: hypothetical protein [unclassified Lentimicrobium]|uniref:hypothetical protein n=1 Tax=unclassified Lentimicrobium TaxID=2677434 RepID=UPI001556F6A7|nr:MULTISPECIES: hypothetical protein [unclassified Lentimicrobium]NPD47970.1 hypothetical protein [Lentimicrobium sp. S6]NPD86964.1 hypothetical protein [Lentimicrobium sp. L6]
MCFLCLVSFVPLCYSSQGYDIDLDVNEKPHLTWREQIEQAGALLSRTYYNAQSEDGGIHPPIWEMVETTKEL